MALATNRTGEPDGVSLRTGPPHAGVRGLTPPGSPAWEWGRDDRATLAPDANRLDSDQRPVSSGHLPALAGNGKQRPG